MSSLQKDRLVGYNIVSIKHALPYHTLTDEIPIMNFANMKIRKARDAAKKAQKLLQNVSNRKKNKEVEKDGLVITKAIYGNLRAARGTEEHLEVDDDVASLILDVTLPLNFLVTNSRLEVCYEYLL